MVWEFSWEVREGGKNWRMVGRMFRTEGICEVGGRIEGTYLGRGIWEVEREVNGRAK